MNNKEYYRNTINAMKPYINISGICREVGIAKQTMSTFLMGYDGALSIDKLQSFVDFVGNL